MEFRTAFTTADELAKRTVSDFLVSHHNKKEAATTKGILGLRSERTNFNTEILPILRLLCPSIRPISTYLDVEEKPQYVLTWDEGSLIVPEFVLEESDKHFDEWMALFGIGEEQDAEEEEEEEKFDPYSMVPLEMF
jgi:hypothetical protein